MAKARLSLVAEEVYLKLVRIEVSRFLKNATPTPGDSCEKVDLTSLLAKRNWHYR